MATVVRAAIPVDEFVLAETFDVVPSATFECERIVESGDEVVMPLVWSRGTERESLETALEQDSSVNSFELLAEFDDEYLYRMEWIEHVRLVLQMLTNSNATVLDAYGDATQWQLRIMYPERDGLSRTDEFCEQYDLTFDVQRVREFEGELSGRYGLTAEQFEALTVACERGYFNVPREVDLDDLAAELDISHQALSERLRRGHEALIEETLFVGTRS